MKTIKNEWLHWVILSIPIIYLARVYSTLPGVVPTNFHGNGIPDDYSHKTLFLWITPLLTWGMYLLLMVVIRISPQKQLTLNTKVINSLRLAFTIIFSALSIVAIYLAQPKANVKFGIQLIIAGVIIITVVIFIYIYFIYKKMRSLSKTASPADDKEFYKWGIFYYNSNNPNLWVPKRYGLGWTVNMANPFSYLIWAVIIAFTIWSIFISK